MKLWMSGELQADIADAYREVRREIEASVNAKLQDSFPDGPFEEWTVIPIILAEDDPMFAEFSKKHVKSKALEFRLKIDHERFLNGDLRERRVLVLDMLERCIGMMAKMGLSQDQISALRTAVTAVRSRPH